MKKNGVQDLPSIDFLTDFLYVDENRMRSLLSQLFRSGVLDRFKEEHSYTDSYSTNLGVNTFLSADKNSTMQDGNKISYEYNSAYSLPSLLLDALSEHQFIKSNISEAVVGNLVLISGDYRIFDISILEKVVPIMSILNEQGKKKSKDDQNLTKILNLFPKNLQIDFIDEQNIKYWSALKKECLLINIEDLLLSNGTVNCDRWHMLGVLENTPNNQAQSKFNDMKSNISDVYNHIKTAIGRDSDSYAIAPILIFRKISK